MFIFTDLIEDCLHISHDIMAHDIMVHIYPQPHTHTCSVETIWLCFDYKRKHPVDENKHKESLLLLRSEI